MQKFGFKTLTYLEKQKKVKDKVFTHQSCVILAVSLKEGV